MAKAADDRMMVSMAVALRERGVTCVALYPGLVSTELVLATENPSFDMSTAETPEFTGRVIAALAADPDRLALSGAVIPVAQPRCALRRDRRRGHPAGVLPPGVRTRRDSPGRLAACLTRSHATCFGRVAGAATGALTTSDKFRSYSSRSRCAFLGGPAPGFSEATQSQLRCRHSLILGGAP